MKLALVDVDGTLTKKNISVLFGRYLYEQGILSKKTAFLCSFLYALHFCHFISSRFLHQKIASFLFASHPQKEIIEAANRFFSTIKNQLYREDVAAHIRTLCDDNYRIILLSSSPDFLIEKLAQQLYFKEYVGTEYIYTAEGRFSHLGRIISGGEKKAFALQMRNQGYTEMMAFSDSMQDKPLLDIVTMPVAVYPSFFFKVCARYKGWKVVS